MSWPNQRWLWFDCPKCQKGFHVEIEEGRATIGEIDGAPGPAFMPDNSVSVPGLTYNRGSGMTLRLGRRVWRVRGRF